MVIKAIFFDFDGTVSDAKKIAWDSMIKTLDEFGYNYSKKKLAGLLGCRTRLIFKGLGLDLKNMDVVRNKFYKYFTQAAADGKIKPCVSLKPLWEIKKEVPLIVVSNSRTSFLKASIKTLKIKGLFDKVYGSEKFETKNGMLDKLFKKMKIKPSEVIYVGDRFSDIEFARKSGCIAVAIHNRCSWSTLKRIEKEKPDYIVRDFYGLRKILNKLNN